MSKRGGVVVGGRCGGESAVKIAEPAAAHDPQPVRTVVVFFVHEIYGVSRLGLILHSQTILL